MAMMIRFKFKRDEGLRFLSHLDMQRLFQRAFRRAEIPTAFSNGFNPHIKLSFAGALPLGMITDVEYGDLVLSEELSPDVFLRKMNAALPQDLQILEARELFHGETSLAAALKQADYRVTLFDQPEDLASDRLNRGITDFLSKNEIIIKKRNKKKRLVETDIRPYIGDLRFVQKTGADIHFDLSINYIDQKCVKAIQVMQALSEYEALNLNVDESMRLHKVSIIMA